jgi:CheY-like chemotaxis protein
MRVLIVDDEASLRMTLTANLELEGLEVVEADSGERALALAAKERFDLVLSDIRMPGMNGVDLFRHLRRTEPDLPVILMTAFALEGLVEAALSEGVYTVLPKPFAVADLLAVLARAARRPVVLVIDGAPGGAEATAAFLRETGLAVRAAEDPEGALRDVRSGDVDVCVVGASAPGTGPELIARILEEEPEIAVIAIIASEAPEAMRRAAALGVFACLSRPLKPAEVARVIGRARGKLRSGAGHHGG